jgi:hypothetical protein
MNPERKIEAEKIQILNLRTLKGNIDAAADADTEKINGHQFSFELTTGLNLDEKVIGLQLLANITAVDKNEQALNITGSYTHEMVFQIQNLEDFIDTDEKGNIVDAGLISTLTSIIYSTVRGIIYNRTQGTSLGNVILPVINPLKLMGVEQK